MITSQDKKIKLISLLADLDSLLVAFSGGVDSTFLLAVAHGGVRVGRKTYLLDMASGVRRTDYVAVSNTVIGFVLLLGGGVGLLAPWLGPGGMLLLLSMFGFGGVLGGRHLPEVQE